MASKFDKHCDECGCVVENKKGIVKEFAPRNMGDDKNPKWKRVCKSCDAKLKEIYKT